MSISGTMRKRRKELGLSQEALADLTSIKIREISLIENDRRAPSAVEILQIAHALRMDVYDLVGSKNLTKKEKTEGAL